MKVFLVDDSSKVLEKLSTMISRIDGLKIAGQALNARDAIQSIVKLKPEVVILDIRLDNSGNGMDVLKEIKRENPSPIVIMLTNYAYPQISEKNVRPWAPITLRQGDGNRYGLRYDQTVAEGWIII